MSVEFVEFSLYLHVYNYINITSAIQRINGASMKEHWATQRNQMYKQQYQRLQHDTGLKYKIDFFAQ